MLIFRRANRRKSWLSWPSLLRILLGLSLVRYIWDKGTVESSIQSRRFEAGHDYVGSAR